MTSWPKGGGEGHIFCENGLNAKKHDNSAWRKSKTIQNSVTSLIDNPIGKTNG